jgi:hypothetical protein
MGVKPHNLVLLRQLRLEADTHLPKVLRLSPKKHWTYDKFQAYNCAEPRGAHQVLEIWSQSCKELLN